MEILVRLETARLNKHSAGELVMDVKAKRILDPDIKSNSYIAVDGDSIVREFVVELDDYSDEEVKEFEDKMRRSSVK